MHSIINLIKKYKIIIMATLISSITVGIAIFVFVNIKENKIYKKAEEQIIELSQNILKSYKIRPDFWGLSTNEVINKKLYTHNMKAENNKLIGYFNNIVEIGADDNGNIVMPTEKHFVIAYKDLTEKQCFGLLSQKFNKTFWLTINKITVKNEINSQDFIWGDTSFALPISRESLKKSCVSKKNTITLQF